MNWFWERLRRWPESPHIAIWATAAAFLLSLPALGLGLLTDDHYHKARLTGEATVPPMTSAARDLFVPFPGSREGNQVLADLGLFSWWSPADMKLALFRPLSAWTHQVDYALWPDSPWLMHLHSLVWLVLVVLLVGRWVPSGRPRVAGRPGRSAKGAADHPVGTKES